LGRDSAAAVQELKEAETKLRKQKDKDAHLYGPAEDEEGGGRSEADLEEDDGEARGTPKGTTVKAAEESRGTGKAARGTQLSFDEAEGGEGRGTNKAAAGISKGTGKASDRATEKAATTTTTAIKAGPVTTAKKAERGTEKTTEKSTNKKA
jgi:hypothetical protein